MTKISSTMVRCHKSVAAQASLAAAAYYKIKELKKEIKKLKLDLAKNANGITADIEKMIIYSSSAKEVPDPLLMTGASLKSSTFKKDSCSRFMKHLAAGDLVKTVETKDND